MTVIGVDWLRRELAEFGGGDAQIGIPRLIVIPIDMDIPFEIRHLLVLFQCLGSVEVL